MIFTSDFETTTSNNGSPFDLKNKAVLLALQMDNNGPTSLRFPFTEDCLQAIQFNINASNRLVFFNAKFDLHWYSRLGIVTKHKSVWCCQLAEFILSRQTLSYPSLEEAASRYELGTKLDVVKLEYWNKGIDTTEIPPNILAEYAEQDVALTYKVYCRQVEEFKKHPKMYKLFRLACQDLQFLEEMEWNGLPYDIELCNQRSAETKIKIKAILDKLNKIYPDLPINFNSGDQLSAFLYGGPIDVEGKELVGKYKTGPRAGEDKYKTIVITTQLPRLVKPLPNSELKKEGYYKTDTQTLQKLKGPAAKAFVGPLLELSKLEKLNNTYYEGLPKKAEIYGWKPGILHGQFNQCVAVSGRLSSSKPNQQNFAEECLDLFYSRYGSTEGMVDAGGL